MTCAKIALAMTPGHGIDVNDDVVTTHGRPPQEAQPMPNLKEPLPESVIIRGPYDYWASSDPAHTHRELAKQYQKEVPAAIGAAVLTVGGVVLDLTGAEESLLLKGVRRGL